MRQTARIVRREKFSAPEKHHHNFAFGGGIIGEGSGEWVQSPGDKRKFYQSFATALMRFVPAKLSKTIYL